MNQPARTLEPRSDWTIRGLGWIHLLGGDVAQRTEASEVDWLQIDMAARGCVSGTSDEWPDLVAAIHKITGRKIEQRKSAAWLQGFCEGVLIRSGRSESPLSGTNGQLMIMAAHRYCLGRQSYIVGSAIEWLWKWRALFERNTIRVIVRDTVEALQDNRAGSESIDAPGWQRLASDLFREMNDEDRDWIMKTVAHRQQPWPLSST